MHIKIILFAIIILSSWTGLAQEKCATVLFNEQAENSLPNEDKTASFEKWMSKKIIDKKVALRTVTSAAQIETTYQIPVVVHILHQNETLGQESNIPDEQVLSQIQTLNEDFRRLNADASLTPADFASVSADVNIEFVLAKQDPEGLPTNGIIRTQANDTEYNLSDAITMAKLSGWPSEDYLNMWVTNLSGTVIGFATYPLSNELGLHQNDITQENISITDGVFMDYQYFGTGYNTDDFSKGRTTTHEIGHWLGLRHIWGDGGCGVDDYCDDTPEQSSSSSDCPIYPGQVSCSSPDMFQNYMDYTDDVCMNLFTTDQKDRMRIVLENSPRRKSILSSLGDEEPLSVALDLGIVSISSPNHSECNSTIAPRLLLRNYGSNTINSFEVTLAIDDVTVITDSFNEELEALDLIEITLDEIETSSKITDYTLKITSVNSLEDDNADNDCYWVSTIKPDAGSIPLGENFTDTQESQVSDWDIYNESGSSSWQYTLANNGNDSNESIFANYYDSPSEKFGENDYFTSPVINLTGIVSVDLQFSLAYARRSGYSHDGLSIVVSTDCGNTFPSENVIYQQWAAGLATTALSSTSFVPEGSGDWQTKSINFGEFSNEENVVIAFIGTNGGGNNIYLDDITISTQNTLDNDIAIASVDDIVLASCINTFESSVNVKNLGYNNLNSYIIDYEIDRTSFSENITGINVAPGKTDVVTITHNDLNAGESSVFYEIRSPNGETDQNVNNNTAELNYIIDDSEEYSPFNITFSNDAEIQNWNTLRRDSITDWKFTLLDFNRVLTLEAYNNSTIDSKNYFISPSLNVASAEAAIQFDLSYGYNSGKNDRLQVLASNNCGLSFDDIVYDKSGTALATVESSEEWIPSSDTNSDDWRRESIDLSAYGNEGDLRLAFVFTNQNGNNIYIDNLEMFHTSDPDTIALTESIRTFPNPSIGFINVKFNYFSKKDVKLRLVSLSGEIVFEEKIDNILNQIYTIDRLEGMEGIYVLQALTESGSDSKTVLITK